MNDIELLEYAREIAEHLLTTLGKVKNADVDDVYFEVGNVIDAVDEMLRYDL